MRRAYTLMMLILAAFGAKAQSNLITNIQDRKTISLNGRWQYIVDPYETGFYDYRYHELNEKNPDAYWNTDKPANKTEKKELANGRKNRYCSELL